MKYQSPVYSDARGSVAGLTYSRNRGGLYTRARVVVTNPNSTRQQDIRNAMSQLSEYWLTGLTADQRTAWSNYAANVQVRDKLGALIHISGQNHFLRSNLPRQQASLPIVADGPTVYTLPAIVPPSFTASEATTDYTISYDDVEAWCAETDAAMLIYEGRPQNATRVYFRGPYRFNSTELGGSSLPPSSPLNLPSLFTLAEGQHTNLRFRISRADGRLSTSYYVGPVAVGA